MGFFPSIHARTSPLEDAKHDTILEAEIELWQDVEFASTLMLEFPASLQNCEKYISSFFLINYPVKCILLWKQGKTKAHMEKVYISSLSSIFIMRWGLVSLNAFSASNDMIKCQVFFYFVLFFILLMKCMSLVDFCILNHSCIPRLNHLVMICNTLICHWNHFASFCWEFVHLYSPGRLVCSFFVILILFW